MTTPSYGVEQLGLVLVQSTFDTFEAFTTSHGLGFNSMKITPRLDYQGFKEHVGSATLQGEVEGKRGGTFSVESYLKPNGAAAQPQVGPFIRAAGFSYAAGLYTLNTTQPLALQVARKAGDSLLEVAGGLGIKKIEIEIEGSNAAIFKAEGDFASYGCLLGSPVISGALANGAAVLVLAAGHAFKIRPGVQVAIGGNVGAGAGYLITSISADGLTYGISPVVSGGPIIDASVVTAFMPTATIAGTVVGGIEDGLTVDSTSLGFISGKLAVETGVHLLDKEANSNRGTRLGRGARSVASEFMFYFLDENAGLLGKAWSRTATQRAVSMRAGPNTAGSRFIANLPSFRLPVSELEIPDAEETTWKAGGIARKSVANEDEVAFDTN